MGDPVPGKRTLVYPGRAAAKFGRFHFLACIDGDGRGILVTLEAPEGGERPAVRQKLLVAVEGEKAVLFQLRLPLFGSKQPVRLQPVIAVRAEELFGVLPKPVVPELSDGYNKVRGRHSTFPRTPTVNDSKRHLLFMAVGYGENRCLDKRNATRIVKRVFSLKEKFSRCGIHL